MAKAYREADEYNMDRPWDEKLDKLGDLLEEITKDVVSYYDNTDITKEELKDEILETINVTLDVFTGSEKEFGNRVSLDTLLAWYV